MSDGQFLLGMVITLGTIATIAAAYVVHMAKIIRDEYREEIKAVRESAKIEAECRAQERFQELLRSAHVVVRHEIILVNESDIDWGGDNNV